MLSRANALDRFGAIRYFVATMAKARSEAQPIVKHVWLDVAVVFALALAVRLAFFFSFQDAPSYGYLNFETAHFHSLARNLAEQNPVGHESIYRAPAYAYLLSQLYNLPGADLDTALVVQNLVGALTCIAVFLIAAHYFSRKVALTAGVMAALCGPLIFHDNELLPHTFALGLLTWSLYAMLRYSLSGKARPALSGGLFLAFACGLAPESMLLIPIYLIWVYRGSSPGSTRPDQAIKVLLAIIIGLFPIVYQNYDKGREIVPFLTDLSIRTAIANQPNATGRDLRLPDGVREPGQTYNSAVDYAQRLQQMELTLSDLGAFWMKRAIGYFAAQPLSWLGLELRKLGLLISGYEYSAAKPIYFFAGEHFPLNLLLWHKGVAFPMGVILPLALLVPLSMPMIRRRKWLLSACLVVFTIAALLLSPLSQQRLYLIPVLIVAAAAGLWGLIDLYRNGDFQRFYLRLGTLIAGFVVVNLIVVIPGLHKSDAEFDGQMYIGAAQLAQGRLADAEQAFERANRANPRSPRPIMSLAAIKLRSREDSLALVLYNRAAGLDPGDDRPIQGIAAALKRMQNVGELNMLLAKTIREFPQAEWAYIEYADLHVRLREYTQAADIMQRAYEADPTNIDAIFRQGEIYILADMRGEAEEAFKKYLEYRPSSVDAHANLAQVYARQQKLDQALAMFQWVRDRQPFNPGSFFNLSTVYIQLGQYSRARAYLDTTRMIDPAFPRLDDQRRMIDSTAAQGR